MLMNQYYFVGYDIYSVHVLCVDVQGQLKKRKLDSGAAGTGGKGSKSNGKSKSAASRRKSAGEELAEESELRWYSSSLEEFFNTIPVLGLMPRPFCLCSHIVPDIFFIYQKASGKNVCMRGRT